MPLPLVGAAVGAVATGSAIGAIGLLGGLGGLISSFGKNSKESKMVLLILAMKIDGIKDEELDLFLEVARQYNVSDLQKVKSIAKELLSQDNIQIREIFKEYAKENVSEYDKEGNTQFLWTLVNMGFIDGDYSDNERNLVDTYCEIAKLDKTFAREFEDIAKAMVAIVEQKKFLQDPKINSQKSEIFGKELDKNQAVLENSISELISLSATL
ncbi:MAG: TerB family tellurite resistance protein [Campylobacter sp.]|nr:TerB family tellurite resistance protein [Campylobacter sp.]